jgi:hypothetical protein
LILANRADGLTSAARTNVDRERRLTFALGEGKVYGRPINLAQAGLGMRDIVTGAGVPVVNDRRTLLRLENGWMP